MAEVFEVQTRDDDGELRHFPTLREALAYARGNIAVWKVSFGIVTGERVRLVRREGVFVLEQMEDAIKEVLKERGNIPCSDS